MPFLLQSLALAAGAAGASDRKPDMLLKFILKGIGL